MSLTVAIATAAAFAVFGFPFRLYRCWYTWSRVGTNVGVAIYLVIAGGGGGLLGWLAAPQLVAVSPYEWLNGVLAGLAGSLALRADFRLHQSRADRSVQSAASALGKGIDWCTGLLDEATRHHAEQWLRSLDGDALLVVVATLVVDLRNKPAAEVSPAVKRRMLKAAVDAMQVVRSDVADDRLIEARAQLDHFCLEYIVGQHIAKPAQLPQLGPGSAAIAVETALVSPAAPPPAAH